MIEQWIIILAEQGGMPLILSFETEQLRSLCLSEVIAFRELPMDVAKVLFHRLADIRAIDNIFYLPVGKPTEINKNPPGEVLIELSCGYYITLCAAHQRTPVSKDGAVDWENVSRFKLLSVGVKDE